jgi:hypothetical protein
LKPSIIKKKDLTFFFFNENIELKRYKKHVFRFILITKKSRISKGNSTSFSFLIQKQEKFNQPVSLFVYQLVKQHENHYESLLQILKLHRQNN